METFSALLAGNNRDASDLTRYRVHYDVTVTDDDLTEACY